MPTANYNAEDDEYYVNKSGKEFLTNRLENNNSSPVCSQPGRFDRSMSYHRYIGWSFSKPTINFQIYAHVSHIYVWIFFSLFSSKIHEEDYRQIQTNAAFLAPEILSVFANSQIFHDNQPQLKKSSTQPTPIHGQPSREMDSEKLIMRLEGNRRKRNRISWKW